MYSQHSERHFSNRNNWLRASVLGANDGLIPTLAATTLCGLAALGYASAKLGGAPVAPAVLRVCLWGVAALVVTGMIGKLAGVAV